MARPPSQRESPAEPAETRFYVRRLGFVRLARLARRERLSRLRHTRERYPVLVGPCVAPGIGRVGRRLLT